MRFLLITVTALVTGVAAAQQIPDGPGKPAVEKVCGHCHGLATVVGLRRTKAAWDTTVDEMVSRGATATDEELDAVVTYLAKYFGKANINKATPLEIQEIVGLSSADAEAIVHHRATIGDFKDLADLRKVPNIDAKQLEERKDRIAFR
jgi:competence protein ComEA